LTRVMVVDDDLSVCATLVAFLEDCGYEVFSFNSGEGAYEWIRSNRVDVAVVDLRLPAMSGDLLILHMRELYPDLPCVIYTGSPDFDPGSRYVELEDVPVFRKPLVDLTVLLDEVEALSQEVSNHGVDHGSGR